MLMDNYCPNIIGFFPKKILNWKIYYKMMTKSNVSSSGFGLCMCLKSILKTITMMMIMIKWPMPLGIRQHMNAYTVSIVRVCIRNYEVS